MLSAVVLAGGSGTRMGCDKGLAPLRSRPMLEYVLDTVSCVSGDVIVAAAKGCGGRYSDLVGPRARVVEDSEPGRGPLEGLRVAFGHATGDLVLVAPCDVPLVKEEVLRLLMSRAADGGDGAVPVINGLLEPLLAVYAREAGLRWFPHELEQGRGKVSDALGHMDLAMVDEWDIRAVDPDMTSLWNVNTAEDLRRAEELLGTGVTPCLRASSTSRGPP